jgi:hypothetical protein
MYGQNQSLWRLDQHKQPSKTCMDRIFFPGRRAADLQPGVRLVVCDLCCGRQGDSCLYLLQLLTHLHYHRIKCEPSLPLRVWHCH